MRCCAWGECYAALMIPIKPDRAEVAPVLPTERLTYSIRETADLLGVSYFTVFRLLKRGKLHALTCIRHKRIPKAELERFMKEVA